MKTRLVKVGEVNPQELARISKEIKGYMTASELASKLRVNPSTTSRILNAKIAGPVTEDTLFRLAELIKPEMGITREELFWANGYKEEYVYEMDPRSEWREKEALISDILMRCIYNKGSDAWRCRYEARFKYMDMMSLRFDLLIECEDAKDINRPANHLWGFSYLIPRQALSYAEKYKGRAYDQRLAPSRLGATFLQRISLYALMYDQFGKYPSEERWELEELPVKVSYVVERQEEYDYITNKYRELMLPMNASLVLVDVNDGRVKAEFPFRNTDGYRDIPFFDGQYFDDDDNPISEEEYDELLDEMVEDMINEQKDSKNE